MQDKVISGDWTANNIVVYGAYSQSTRIIGESFVIVPSFKVVDRWITCVTLTHDVTKEVICSFNVFTPGDHVVNNSNWFEALEIRLGGSDKGFITTNHTTEKTVLGDAKIISNRNTSRPHFEIVSSQGKCNIIIEDRVHPWFNVLKNGFIFQNDLFAWADDLVKIDKRYIAKPVVFTSHRLQVRVPSINSMELLEKTRGKPLCNITYYVLNFKEKILPHNLIEIGIRGSVAFKARYDTFEESTPDGETLKDTYDNVYATKGLVMKKIGNTFFYAESHDGTVKVSLMQNPIKELVRSISDVIHGQKIVDVNLINSFNRAVSDTITSKTRSRDDNLLSLIDFYDVSVKHLI